MISRRIIFDFVFIFFLLNNFEISSTKKVSKFEFPDWKKHEMAAKKVISCDFEVFGKVQGVFFRKYTEKQAKQLGLHGWCMNTDEGSVKGQLEGSRSEVSEMKNWLQTQGSPKSRIDKAIFSEMREIPQYTFKNFIIRR